MGTFNGVYEPLFEGVGGFASISGTFVIASGGGLIATTAGTTASGIINLPQIVNGSTMVWRFAALIQYNGDSTNNTDVYVQNPNDTSYGNFIFYISGGNLCTSVGGNSQLSVSGAVSGNSYWFVAASDGNQVITAIIPAAHGGIIAGSGTAANENYKIYAATYANGAHTPAFEGMGQIYITQKSTTNIVKGVFFNIGSLSGGSDSRMQPPAICPVSITRPDGTVDNTGIVFIPETYHDASPGQPQYLVNHIHVTHPNNSTEQRGFLTTDPDGGAAFAYLRNAGFIMSLIRGDPSSFSNNYASPWGGANGLGVRRQLLAWIAANLPYVNNLFIIGQSMGGLDGLNLFMNDPSSISGYAGISAVANMTAAYNGSNSGTAESSTIDAVYPSYYVSLQNSNTGNALSNTTWWQQVTLPGGLLQAPYATDTNEGAYSSGTTYASGQVVYSNATAMSQLADHDPTLRPGAFVNLPMEFWHGTSDTTIPLAQLQAFQTAMSNLGVTVTINQVSGGHLANSALWNGSAIASLFRPATVPKATSIPTYKGGGV